MRHQYVTTFFLGISIGIAQIATAQLITWSNPLPANADADSDSRADTGPRMATDGDATWVIVSNEFNDHLHVTRSTNGGASWLPGGTLYQNLLNFRSIRPHIAYADGVWMVAFQLGQKSADVDSDWDIAFLRSIDNGETWTDAQYINPGFDGDTDRDAGPVIAGMGDGVWVVAWRSASSGQNYIRAVRTDDDGETWSDVVLNRTTSGGIDSDERFDIAADGAGTFIIVYGQQFSIGSTASLDSGLTWNPNVTVISQGVRLMKNPRIATDRRGRWLVATLFRNGLTPWDYYSSRSTDNGATWTGPSSINFTTWATGINTFHDVVTDEQGTWVAVWDAGPLSGFSVPARFKHFAVSFNGGANWSDVDSPISNIAHSSNDLTGTLIRLAVDKNGQWRAVWNAAVGYGQSLGNDQDLFVSDTRFTGNIEGAVTEQGIDTLVDCAAIIATPENVNGLRRISVTDAIGSYRVFNIPPDTYTLDVHAVRGSIENDDLEFARFTGGATIAVGETVNTDIEIEFNAVENGLAGVVTTEGKTPEELIPVFAAKVEAITDTETFVTYTCGTGAYAISGIAAKGPQTLEVAVRITANGLITSEETVLLTVGQNTNYSPTLTKAVDYPSSLSGVVTGGATDGAIEGARVNAAGAVNLTTTTNASGAYSFDLLIGGVYDVRASKAAYDSTEIDVTVSNQIPAVLPIEMFEEGFEDTEPTDLNADGEINSTDIQLVINAVLGIVTGPINADVNGDNQVNASDIQMVINAVLGV